MASASADARLASVTQRVGGHRRLHRQSLDGLEHGPAPVGDLCSGFGRLRMRRVSPPRRRAAPPSVWIAVTTSSAAGACVRRDDGASQTIDLGDDLPRSGSGVARRGRCRQQVGGVGESGEPLRARLRMLFDLEEPLRECDQRAGEVAAVDGRDVARVQRRQAGRVVPVEKVPAIPLEALERRRASRPGGGAARRSTCSRGRARPASTAGPCRCWWVTCGAPASASSSS